MQKTTVAVSGDQGSFSEEAGLLYAKQKSFESVILFATDMEGVLLMIDRGEAELGIFPVVNSRGGLVEGAYEAMGRHLFTLVDTLPLDVHQCLLALPGVSKSAITEIVSYTQALTQCERYLATEFPGVPLKEWQDTAKAAADLGRGVLPQTAAVVAPERSAELYHLSVLEKGIEDQKPNLTTFIIVRKL